MFAVRCVSMCLGLATLAVSAVGQVDDRPARLLWRGTDQFNSARASNALTAMVQKNTKASGVARDSIYLHPKSEGRATADFAPVPVAVPKGSRLLFVTFAGLSDSIPWGDADHPADGVRYYVTINGVEVLQAEVKESKWVPLAAEVATGKPAGEEATITIQLATDPGPENNSNYDWAHFGEPLLVAVPQEPLRAGTPVSGTGGVVAAWLKSGRGKLIVEGLDAAGRPVEGVRKEEVAEAPGTAAALFDFSTHPEVVAWRFRLEGAEADRAYGGSWAPSLQVTSVAPAQAVYVAGESVKMRIGVKNIGLAGLLPEHGAVFEVAGQQQRLDRLPPGESAALEFDLGPRQAGPLAVDYSWKVQEESHRGRAEGFYVWPALPTWTAARPEKQARATKLSDDYVLCENADVRWLINTRAPGMGAIVWAWGDGPWLVVSTVSPMVQMLNANGQGAPVVFDTVSVDADGGAARLQATGRWQSADGRIARVTLFLRLPPDSEIAEIDLRVQADQDLELGAVRGPAVHVGDRSTRTAKGIAIFPGLEYLEGDEPSSSTRDFAPPLNERWVPHKFKVTVPMMMVETRDRGPVVALIWDPRQKWDGEHDAPAACFASPNFLEHQDNHLMQLMLPSTPDFIPENSRLAEKPYLLRAGRELRLRQFIAAGRPSPDATGSFSWFDRTIGFPEAENWPRSFEEEMALCRHAFLHTVWDAENRKSYHTVGGPKANAPGFATLMLMDARAVAQGQARQELLDRVRLIAETTVREQGPGGLASSAMCHIMKWEFPYHWGSLPGALAAMRGEAYGTLGSQEEDGAWAFHPDENRKILGPDGAKVSGTSAGPAYVLAKYAAISGDPVILEAMKKALAWLRTQKVPRGAQGWECPIFEPDVLASAMAVRAFVWGYMATGDESYLDDARFWARTGLPFQYAWDDGQHPGMRYASIPVFGSTFMTHSWLGLPVQWCGLVYAYGLVELQRFDRNDWWRKQVEGMTVSAMYQQWPMDNPELAGTYPDSFARYFAGRNPVFINPEDIQVNLMALRGLDPGLRVARAQLGGGWVSVAAPGDVSAGVEGDALQVQVKYVPGEIVYLTVAPVALGQDATFTGGGETLSHNDELAPGTTGWAYHADTHILCLGVRCDAQGVASIVLRGLAYSPLSPPQPKSSWEFDEGAEGWTVANSCNVGATGGALQVLVTGFDPYVFGGPCEISAAKHKKLRLRVRATGGNQIGLFWRTKSSPAFGEDKHVNVPLSADGQWHEVVFDLSDHPLWKGTVIQLRLDVEPAETPAGTLLEVDWIRAE